MLSLNTRATLCFMNNFNKQKTGHMSLKSRKRNASLVFNIWLLSKGRHGSQNSHSDNILSQNALFHCAAAIQIINFLKKSDENKYFPQKKASHKINQRIFKINLMKKLK